MLRCGRPGKGAVKLTRLRWRGYGTVAEAVAGRRERRPRRAGGRPPRHGGETVTHRGEVPGRVCSAGRPSRTVTRGLGRAEPALLPPVTFRGPAPRPLPWPCGRGPPACGGGGCFLCGQAATGHSCSPCSPS